MVRLSNWVSLIILCIVLGNLSAQTPNVGEKLRAAKATGDIRPVELFNRAPKATDKDPRYGYISAFERLELNESGLNQLIESPSELISIDVPGNNPRTIELYRTELLSSNYRIRTERGIYSSSNKMFFYHGKLKGDKSSIATLTVFPDDVRMMFADATGTYRIEKSEDGAYIVYRKSDMVNRGYYSCETPETGFTDPATEGISVGTRSIGGCVEIYFECDFDSYEKNNSSVEETEQWVTDLFNEVSIFYENENVPVAISDIKVWTTTDPYAGLNSTGDMLDEFVSQIAANPYEGRLAHLLSTRSVGGGIAYVDVLCSTTIPCAVSASLSTIIQPATEYSWNVEVVTHELGHNFGSRHTHACVWNGDNTQIDDCGNSISGNPGSCYDADNPIWPTNGGTIMSYCHLTSYGINFDHGFGPQPGSLIYNNFISAPCTTGECAAPPCTGLTTPVPGASNVESLQIIEWDGVIAATGYKVTIGTSTGGIDIANNVDVGNVTSYDPGGLPFDETIFVTIVPYNGLGDATDCNEYQFTIESSTAPECTEVTSPADGSTEVELDADLFWTHSVGEQISYKINMGYSPGSTELLSNEDVGNVNTYDPGLLPADTQVYVQIIPVGQGGSTTEGCTITNFRTSNYDLDFCEGAVSIICGTSVSGSTVDAGLDDVQSCGTSVTAPGVWYTFVGDGSNVTLSMCGAADYDSKISVYRGSCSDLICVTGNDDQAGCNYASEVSFSTINGSTYFVLVHGYSDNTGGYTLTMACADPPLCPAQSIIAEDEWISNFEFGSFSNASGQNIYSDFTDMMIDIAAGTTYPVSVTPDFAGQSYNEFFGIWADLNNDGDFEDPGELLWDAGPSTQTVTGNVTIPQGIGNGEFRLRVSMKYNTAPEACEVFTYGEVEEYTLRIQCGNVLNTDDSGESSLRAAISCAQSGDTIKFDPSLQGSSIQLTSTPIVIDKDIVIDAAESNITVSAVVVSRVFDISAGSTVTIIGLGLKGGLAVAGSAIRNSGVLNLRDVVIDQHSSGDGNLLVDNLGDLTLLGNCSILDP